MGLALNCALVMMIVEKTRSAALMDVDMHVLTQSVCHVTSGSTSVWSRALTLLAGYHLLSLEPMCLSVRMTAVSPESRCGPQRVSLGVWTESLGEQSLMPTVQD